MTDAEEDRVPAASAAGVEWNAPAYHRLSTPQVEWGRRVLGRLQLRGDETVMDAGCGSGHLTELLLQRVPRGKVIAVDRSANMVREARKILLPQFGDRVEFVCSDLVDLSLAAPVDVIFSNATFHWVRDHGRLFHVLFAALAPGGSLLAQCGGAGNIALVIEHARHVISSLDLDSSFVGWDGPWTYADPQTTAERMRLAGFVDVVTGLEQAPVVLDSASHYREFIETVIFNQHLPRISDPADRERFLAGVTAEASRDTPPFLLDYVRLNLAGGRPPA